MRELRGALRIHDHVPYAAALDSIVDVGARELRCRRDDDGSKTDCRKHRLPERHDIRQHDENAVAAFDARVTQIPRDPPRAIQHLIERYRLLSAVGDHTQGRPPIALREFIEPMRRPIESLELWPSKRR